MKKFLALLLSAILILGVFAGCGNAAKPGETTAETTAPAAKPAGTLYLSFGPTIEVAYDDAGNVLQITGTNEAGKTIADASADQVGKACVFAARKFLRYASDNKLLGDAKSMVVRVGIGDPLPDDEFLSTIVTDCQYLADEESTGIWLMQLTQEALDSDGNMTPAAAKKLAARFLEVEESALVGDDTITQGAYIYTGADKSCSVDAFTGLVTKK